MDALLQTLRNLGPMRLAVMGLVGLGLLGLIVFAVSRISTPPMELLFKDLDMNDSARIVKQLESMGEPFQIRENGSAIMVPSDKVLRLRMSMADQGLPSGGSVGYELFDNANTMGTTDFVQNVNLVRALEGELARTIRALDPVQSARVHLVLPRRELFSRQTQMPTASIIVKLKRGGRLNREQVGAIQHLVAAAVPQLVPEHVSVVDERGTLLARGFEDAGGPEAAAAMKNEERRLALQRRLTETVENLVAQAVGYGNVRAEVNAELDFDRITTQQEIYDPEGQVVRSTQTVDGTAQTKESDGTPPVSVGTNLPDFASQTGAPGASSNEQRNEETVNYEISKKIVSHIREGGYVKRLTIALLVDGTYATGADGKRTYQPRPEAELEKIGTLARNAIGFDANRGDTLDVINLQFADLAGGEDTPLDLFMGLTKADLLDIAELLLYGIIIVLVLLLIVRPMVVRFLETQPLAASVPEGRLLTDRASAPPALTGPAPLPVEGMIEEEEPSFEELIDIDRVEGRVKASSVKKVGEIVEKHPMEALAIIRTWMYQES